MIANCAIVFYLSFQEIFICYLSECDRDRSRHSRQKILRYLLILKRKCVYLLILKHKCLFVTKMLCSYFSVLLIN